MADGTVRPVLAALEPSSRHHLHEVATTLHADGSLSRGTLSRFVAAYQSVQPLTLGEVGPVAWSEGVRMASLLYADRVIDDTEPVA